MLFSRDQMGGTPPSPPAPPAGPDRGARPVPTFVRSSTRWCGRATRWCYLVSWEEQRLDVILEDLAKNHGKTLYSWSATQGLRKIQGARYVPPSTGPRIRWRRCSAIEKLTEPVARGAQGLPPLPERPHRGARAARARLPPEDDLHHARAPALPALSIPTELEKDMSVLDVPLPTFEDLRQLLTEIVAGGAQEASAPRSTSTAGRRRRPRQGRPGAHPVRGRERLRQGHRQRQPLSTPRTCSSSSTRSGRSSARAGCSSTTRPRRSSQAIGGLENLKAWLARRGARLRRGGATLRPARAEGAPAARRAGLRQVPHRQGGRRARGSCRSCASTWGGSSAGSSAPRRRTCARPSSVAESVAPAVLWIDEIEKGLSGIGSLGLVGRRRHRPRLRHASHLAAGEDRAGLRRRHRQPHRRPAARSCCARGASTRSSSSTCRPARGAAGDLRHPPAQAQARPGALRPRRAREARGGLLRRRDRAGGGGRASTTPSPTARSWSSAPRQAPWPRPSRSPPP